MKLISNFAISALAVIMLEAHAAPMTQVDFSDVEVALRKGQTAIAEKAFDNAIAECESGLKKLGAAYVRSDVLVLDDTDLKLMAANILRKEGKVENASTMYCNMLAVRLDQLWSKQRR